MSNTLPMNTKPWLQHYPDFMPAEITDPPFNSLAAMCEDVCKRFAEIPALENMDKLSTVFTNE